MISLYLFGLALVLVQASSALPWMWLVNQEFGLVRFRLRDSAFVARFWGVVLVIVAVLGAIPMRLSQDHDSLQYAGGVYGVVLHLQLTLDFFIIAMAVLLQAWPKGAAVALAAFREGWRQPMFWLLFVLALICLIIAPFIPYFTFGEDFKMVKELGYDTIKLFTALFAVLAASMSISEEIEGRTAVTLMSKPVSRRQFLIGKFLGILMAALLMTGFLSWVFDGVLLFKLRYDGDPIPIPNWLDPKTKVFVEFCGETPAYFLRGIAFWFAHVVSVLPGVVLQFCEVMVLLAIAVALATRLPMVVNMVICLVVFFLGHLTPVLEQVSRTKYALVRFMSQLFDTLLPGLDLFNLGPSIARDKPLDADKFAVYVGVVALYALLYTIIALLFGLILFEDRDLA